jgi:hypothetical protein
VTELPLEGEPLCVGDQVRLSEAGLKRQGSRRGGYQGTVVKLYRGSMSVSVHFEGYKTPVRIHVKYLEPDQDW